MHSNNKIVFQASAKDFERIPGVPIAYWVSVTVFNSFLQNKSFSGITRKGVLTGKTERFVRFWHEVSKEKIGTSVFSHEQMISSNFKWFFVTSGGTTRKWSGNIDSVVNLENDGEEIKRTVINYRLREAKFYFREAITWTEVCTSSFSSRYVPKGVLFGNGGPVAFFDDSFLTYCLGLLNSKVTASILEFLAPTLNYGPEQISKIPQLVDRKGDVEGIVSQNISLSRSDWDSYETSWDFQRHPLAIVHPECGVTSSTVINGVEQDIHQVPLLQLHYAAWERECRERFNQLKANEEELNRIFIEIYGLQDELTPEVEDKDVTVRLADRGRDIRSFISYLIGIIMGRYSLDTPGLAYAGGEWDATKYTTYQPDDDGIVPIYPSLGMEDGLAARIIDLLKRLYGEESYYENIDFIAEALGKARNESSEETLNRYLNDDFYADHLKIYQKRPIYWLLSSGKHGGFKCLIYMHRYKADTLARVNGRYFLPETTRQKYELQELDKQVASAEGRERVKLEKERQKRIAAYQEALEYGQILDHLANQSIEIDLDDGVKVNYAKFQGIELVTDNGTKVKKDLLSPIK